MRREKYYCKDCGTQIQGNSEYCVLCYSRLVYACPDCMTMWADGTWHVLKRGKPPQPIDCAACKNERWILRAK